MAPHPDTYAWVSTEAAAPRRTPTRAARPATGPFPLPGPFLDTAAISGGVRLHVLRFLR